MWIFWLVFTTLCVVIMNKPEILTVPFWKLIKKFNH